MGLPNHKFGGCHIIKNSHICVLGRCGVWVLDLVKTIFFCGGLPDHKFGGCPIIKNACICFLGRSKLWVLDLVQTKNIF